MSNKDKINNLDKIIDVNFNTLVYIESQNFKKISISEIPNENFQPVRIQSRFNTYFCFDNFLYGHSDFGIYIYKVLCHSYQTQINFFQILLVCFVCSIYILMKRFKTNQIMFCLYEYLWINTVTFNRKIQTKK